MLHKLHLEKKSLVWKLPCIVFVPILDQKYLELTQAALYNSTSSSWFLEIVFLIDRDPA